MASLPLRAHAAPDSSIAKRTSVVGGVTVSAVHLLPSKCAMLLSRETQTSFLARPKIANALPVPGIATGFHALPSKRSALRSGASAHTSSGALAHTSVSAPVPVMSTHQPSVKHGLSPVVCESLPASLSAPGGGVLVLAPQPTRRTARRKRRISQKRINSRGARAFAEPPSRTARAGAAVPPGTRQLRGARRLSHHQRPRCPPTPRPRRRPNCSHRPLSRARARARARPAR